MSSSQNSHVSPGFGANPPASHPFHPTISAMPPSADQHGKVQQPTSTAPPKNRAVPISSLMSPPEPTLYDTFSHGPQASMTLVKGNPAQHPPSPPVSPWTQASNQVTQNSPGRDSADPILFPEESAGSVQPLFPQPLVAPEAINEHLAARSAEPLPMGVKPPTKPEYALFSGYINTQWDSVYVALKTEEERRAYCKREREQLKLDHEERKKYLASLSHGSQRRPLSMQAPRKPKPLAAKAVRPNSSGFSVGDLVNSATGPRHVIKITKPTASRAGRTSLAPTRNGSTPRESTPPRPAKRVKTGKTQVTDADFARIPDYCPPISSLDDVNGKKMIIAQVNNPREFNEEDKKYLHLLHPMEQELARHEKLGAANYLTVKRRIFVDRLHFYHFEKEQQEELDRQGKKDKKFVKNFLKTHAQEAGKMDVNKASRLHTAFDSVGWLDTKWCEGLEKPTFCNIKDRVYTAEDYKSGSLPGPQKHFKRGAAN